MHFLRQIVHSLSQAVKQRLRQWTKPDNHILVLNTALDLTCPESELILENLLLRQQLIVLKRQVNRPKLTWRDRTLLVLLASKLRTWKETLRCYKKPNRSVGSPTTAGGNTVWRRTAIFNSRQR